MRWQWMKMMAVLVMMRPHMRWWYVRRHRHRPVHTGTDAGCTGGWWRGWSAVTVHIVIRINSSIIATV